MPTSNDDAALHQPPGRALEQATDEPQAAPDLGTTEPRAGDLAMEARERADEEHDEYDDPDLGGEA
jgi:hypothetical protein